MATPLIASAVAIIEEYFQNGYYYEGIKDVTKSKIPSSSLVKAMVIHSGENAIGRMSRNQETTQYTNWPNSEQGHGILSLDKVLYFADEPHFRLEMNENCLLHNDTYNIYEYYLTGLLPFKVTLVWTDPPNDPRASKMLINDLDLSVEIGNRRYFSNGLNKSDVLNNVEVIRFPEDIDNLERKLVKIKVLNKGISTFQQCYSMVITGDFYDGIYDEERKYEKLPRELINNIPYSIEINEIISEITEKPIENPTSLNPVKQYCKKTNIQDTLLNDYINISCPNNLYGYVTLKCLQLNKELEFQQIENNCYPYFTYDNNNVLNVYVGLSYKFNLIESYGINVEYCYTDVNGINNDISIDHKTGELTGISYEEGISTVTIEGMDSEFNRYKTIVTLISNEIRCEDNECEKTEYQNYCYLPCSNKDYEYKSKYCNMYIVNNEFKGKFDKEEDTYCEKISNPESLYTHSLDVSINNNKKSDYTPLVSLSLRKTMNELLSNGSISNSNIYINRNKLNENNYTLTLYLNVDNNDRESTTELLKETIRKQFYFIERTKVFNNDIKTLKLSNLQSLYKNRNIISSYDNEIIKNKDLLNIIIIGSVGLCIVLILCVILFIIIKKSKRRVIHKNKPQTL